ncbi:uncharacterized protein PV06_03825 [Exophiala oligosperma]|uniref:Glycosyltransferase 2-like domain-containing protein n=1 Tax=Exophiala oligosperma TaxID=215243 RepID=A0A0D2DRA6_9EURO|nr:uncharacterized protein PV06_03825 [Exophiala oligosperma]KIW45433.1 hypothetical protein PV06_03825 [Exophiala oligosperma]
MADSDAGTYQLDVTSPEAVRILKALDHPKYNIVQLGDKPKMPISYVANAFGVLALFQLFTYLTLLYYNISLSSRAGINTLAAKLFLTGQCFEHFGTIGDNLWRLLVSFKRSEIPRPTLRLLGDKVPLVDLFIVSCGEPRDIVLDTVKAALQIDYPRDRFRVILSDDGKDMKLKKACEGIKIKYHNLHYWARKKGKENHGYKAGNLNTAIRKLDKPAEFKAVFDADMIPEPSVLRVLIPHILIDDRVGMVTCAQHHYNIPDNDPLYQANVTGPGADDGLRDSVNASWCPGSGFIIRHDAWFDIGGFPEFSITEDLITSWLLHGRGWKIALVHEVLQWGIQPDCIISHLKQRRRWWTGHIRDSWKLKFSFHERLRGATFVQRFAMFHHCLRPWFYTVCRLGGLLLCFIAMTIGPVVATPRAHSLLNVILVLAFRWFFSTWSDWKSIHHGIFWNLRRRQATNVWLANHFSRDAIQTLIPFGFLGWGKKLGFEISGADKSSTGIKERYVEKRPKEPKERLFGIQRHEGILYHGVVAVVYVIAIVVVLVLEVRNPSPNFWHRIMARIGFPGMCIIEVAPLYLTPIVYTIYPPTMPKRRDCMVYNAELKVWRAAEKYKTIKWTRESWWLEVPHALALTWLVSCMFYLHRLQGSGANELA